MQYPAPEPPPTRPRPTWVRVVSVLLFLAAVGVVSFAADWAGKLVFGR